MSSTYRLALVFAFSIAHVASTCWYPNGNKANNDTPCSPSQANSTCCGVGLACLSNNLCGVTQYRGDTPENDTSWYIRGTCTDQSWTDPACLKRCMKNGNELSGNGAWVYQCLSGTRDRYYCKNDKTKGGALRDLCFEPKAADGDLFQLDGNPSTLTIISQTMTSTATIPSASPSASSSSSSSSSSAIPTAISTSCPEYRKPDYILPIGVGVGVPLGIMALGLLGYLWTRHQRQQTLLRVAVEADTRKSEPIGHHSNPYSTGVNTRPILYRDQPGWGHAHLGELSAEAGTHELPTEPKRNH